MEKKQADIVDSVESSKHNRYTQGFALDSLESTVPSRSPVAWGVCCQR